MQSSKPSPPAADGPTHNHAIDEPTLPPKRKRDPGRLSYPRKRALRACDACRKRKIKCDNQRPTCGGCKDLEIECDIGESKNDRSTYDLASLEILERLDYAVGLLEATRDPPLAVPIQQTSPMTDGNITHVTPILHHPTPGSIPWSDDNAKGDAEILLESLEIAGRNPQVSEDILDWPIFQGKYDRSRTESLIFNPRQGVGVDESVAAINADAVRSRQSSRGIHEEDVPHLINKFLVNVHIKNPIVDADDIKSKGRRMTEHGFAWDGASCLVLIVCALANLSTTFTPEPVTSILVDGPNGLTSPVDNPEYPTAENYYVAAQKRIGLLENSIITTQCYFLTGVYEMYSLRPLKAWSSFNRACVSLQIYLRGQLQRSFSSSKGLERRLYWSCLKSECEIRMEVNLPPSGLAKVNYPDGFPSPPAASPVLSQGLSGTIKPIAHRSSFAAIGLEPDTELIWCYYISEIAVRKIGNRVMNCFYEHDEAAWLSMSPTRMIRVAEELEMQLTQWFSNLPTSLAATATPTEAARDHLVREELKFMLHPRLLDFRERIYRPFLYLCLYYPTTDPIQEALAPYVHRHVQVCINALLRGLPRHRHHGTWFEARGMFLKSLLLIAAVKSKKIHVASAWQEGVNFCIAGFKFWEQESPDLREARFVIESLLSELDRP